jgi:predicted transcriptional regulator
MASANLSEKSAAERLEAGCDTLMRQFLEKLRLEAASAQAKSDSILADSLPELIREMAACLRKPCDTAQMKNVNRTAEQHAMARKSLSGYNIVQILNEYHLLRRLR